MRSGLVLGVTPSRSRRRDGGDGANTSPSLALRACSGGDAKPEPTPGRRPIKAPDASRGTPRGSGYRPPCKTGLAQIPGVPSLALRAWIRGEPPPVRRAASAVSHQPSTVLPSVIQGVGRSRRSRSCPWCGPTGSQGIQSSAPRPCLRQPGRRQRACRQANRS